MTQYKQPSDRFNKMFKLLNKILYQKCIIGNELLEIVYFNDKVSLKYKKVYNKFFIDKVFTLDVPYKTTINDVPLYQWLVRPNMKQCEIELEMLIINLL